MISVDIKDLNNDGLDDYYCNLVTLVTPGHSWSHWSLSRSGTSTIMTLIFIMALLPQIGNLSREEEESEKFGAC